MYYLTNLFGNRFDKWIFKSITENDYRNNFVEKFVHYHFERCDEDRSERLYRNTTLAIKGVIINK